MQNKLYSNHHRIGKCHEKDGYNVHHQDNQGKILDKIHVDLHRLFGCMLPHEQLEFILNLNRQVMQKHHVKKIEEIIYASDFYLNHLYHAKRDRKRGHKAG